MASLKHAGPAENHVVQPTATRAGPSAISHHARCTHISSPSVDRPCGWSRRIVFRVPSRRVPRTAAVSAAALLAIGERESQDGDALRLRRAAAFFLPSVQHRFLLNPIRGRRAAAFLLAATQVPTQSDSIAIYTLTTIR